MITFNGGVLGGNFLCLRGGEMHPIRTQFVPNFLSHPLGIPRKTRKISEKRPV